MAPRIVLLTALLAFGVSGPGALADDRLRGEVASGQDINQQQFARLREVQELGLDMIACSLSGMPALSIVLARPLATFEIGVPSRSMSTATSCRANGAIVAQVASRPRRLAGTLA
eukprot:CAMPEP_0203858090 /NCGR_PEP_ID=MMETSP0359-20131031/11089_1 /ASSEMBLY_ACC=CAM_ASM_000338 /TAXON_ID=268821 /ORGANISM="Scrippsiella Hangoei, Strain SHTV-5" /LENGTH=114 /DNA_ID=CAMNT_0050774843 /DNA_START=41 /DNA_END=386 /DNA_ORIENTATION=+